MFIGKTRVALLLALGGAWLVASCSAPPTPPTAAPTAQVASAAPQTQAAGPTAIGSAYPGPQTTAASPVAVTDSYPGPQSAATSTLPPAPFTVPTPTDQTGVVTGQLVDETGKPYLGSIQASKAIYPIQKTATVEPIFAFSNQDPMATQDPATGKFAIGQLAPGPFGLTLWSPAGQILITDPKTGAPVMFTITAGKTVDLGVITIH